MTRPSLLRLVIHRANERNVVEYHFILLFNLSWQPRTVRISKLPFQWWTIILGTPTRTAVCRNILEIQVSVCERRPDPSITAKRLIITWDMDVEAPQRKVSEAKTQVRPQQYVPPLWTYRRHSARTQLLHITDILSGTYWFA